MIADAREKDLWQQYSEQPGDETRNNLIEYYLPWFERIAANQWHLFPDKIQTQISIDDLLSAIVLAMPAAIEKYEPERCLKPLAYLGTRAKFSLKDYLREIDWVPRTVRAAGVPVVGIGSLESHPYQINADEAWPGFGGSHKVEHDCLCVDDLRFEQIDQRELAEVLLLRVTDSERQALTLYYLEGMKMKAVGVEMGIGESRVSQLVSAGLAQIKSTLTESDIENGRRSG